MAQRNPPHGNDEKPRGPTGPLVPFPSNFFDLGEPAGAQSFPRRFLRKLIDHWQIVAGCVAFTGVVSSALVLSWIRSSQTSESVASTLNEEASKATRPKKETTASPPDRTIRQPADSVVRAGRPPLALPEEIPRESEAPAEPPHGDRPSAEARQEARAPTAPWSPQTPDELALWEKLSSRTQEELEGILTKASEEGANSLSAGGPKRVSRQALAALAALGRENELTRLCHSERGQSLSEESRPRAQGNLPPMVGDPSPPPTSSGSAQDDKPGGATENVPSTSSSDWLAQEEVPLEKLLALLTADGQDRTALLGWRSTLEAEKEATALKLAALKRVTEAGFPEAHTTLLAMPALFGTPTDDTQNSAANPTVWANLYGSLVRQDSVLSRYVLATELLGQPRVEQRTLLVEAIAGYGTMNHRGLLLLAQADPDLWIRTRAKEILSAHE